MKDKPLIIGIDGNEANVERTVGVSVYTINLLKAFQEEAQSSLQFQIFLRNPPRNTMPQESSFFRYRVVPGPILWSQIALPIALLYRRPVDLFFSPAHYTPRYAPVPVVVTIHDLSYIFYPDEFLAKDRYKLTNWTRHAVHQATEIIAVSKTTKKDIVSHYEIDENRVKVIYNGFSLPPSFSDSQKILTQHNLQPEKYILYVGTVQPRKNIPVLIDAFQKIAGTLPQMKLVIVGKKGWLYEHIYKAAEDAGVSERVIFTGYVPDPALHTLYKNAFCFVLPSLYEGFGIPLLEAMAHGCPTIASYRSSLPEIGAEASLYFDPESSDALTEKLILLQSDGALRKSLITKGKERAQTFSWKKCAQETLAVLKSTAFTQ